MVAVLAVRVPVQLIAECVKVSLARVAPAAEAACAPQYANRMIR